MFYDSKGREVVTILIEGSRLWCDDVVCDIQILLLFLLYKIRSVSTDELYAAHYSQYDADWFLFFIKLLPIFLLTQRKDAEKDGLTAR